uniref:Transmembrane protein n=1 Tax=Loa loa TaxID=7209 RepID=A0A1I7VJH4_LOALO
MRMEPYHYEQQKVLVQQILSLAYHIQTLKIVYQLELKLVKIANWRHCHIDDEKLDKQWILQEAVNIGAKITMINWSTISGILAVSTGITVTLLKEQPILAHMNENVG